MTPVVDLVVEEIDGHLGLRDVEHSVSGSCRRLRAAPGVKLRPELADGDPRLAWSELGQHESGDRSPSELNGD